MTVGNTADTAQRIIIFHFQLMSGKDFTFSGLIQSCIPSGLLNSLESLNQQSILQSYKNNFRSIVGFIFLETSKSIAFHLELLLVNTWMQCSLY